jgi:hypothetical protein
MISSPTGRRPLPALAYYGFTSESSANQGTMRSISSRKTSHRLFRPYF